MNVVAYGAGTNSTAMLVGLHERGEPVDLILFADTGGERSETYKHLAIVSEWCNSVGFPEIITVKAPTKTLEQDCLDRGQLPSIAYGFKTCSLRFKKDPQDKYIRNNVTGPYTRLIGIDAGETQRAKEYKGTRYPLIEWDWGRDECVAAIERAGLPQPGKSACFFCPSSKPREILELKRNHPDLLARALAMEAKFFTQPRECSNCNGTGIVAPYLTQVDIDFDDEFETTKCPICFGAGELQRQVKGLGRNWSWTDFIAFGDKQLELFRNDIEEPCGCYDGESE